MTLQTSLIVAAELVLFLSMLVAAYACFNRARSREHKGKLGRAITWITAGITFLLLAWQVWERTALSSVRF